MELKIKIKEEEVLIQKNQKNLSNTNEYQKISNESNIIFNLDIFKIKASEILNEIIKDKKYEKITRSVDCFIYPDFCLVTDEPIDLRQLKLLLFHKNIRQKMIL